MSIHKFDSFIVYLLIIFNRLNATMIIIVGLRLNSQIGRYKYRYN